jgi:hypothetical protein
MEWLKAPSILGLPRWGIGLFVLGFLVEYLLGRSKNPRFRSIAVSLANFLKLVITGSGLSRIPGLGGVLVSVLNAIAPSGELCKVCGGDGYVHEEDKPKEPAAPVAPSEADTTPVERSK